MIRVADESDAEGMLEIYAPIVLETAISFEAQSPTVAEFQGRIRASLERRLWLVCDAGGRIAGYAYATQFNPRDSYIWSVEVSVYVHPGFHRRGIGRALYTSLFRCLAAQGYCTAVARITLPNPSSVTLHEAMGFRPVGANEGIGYKNGEWHDVGIWQMDISPRPLQPQPPLPFTSLAGTPEWDNALAEGAALLKSRGAHLRP